MTKLLAAVDNSTAALPVVGTACAVADLFGAKVEALHVTVDGADLARAAANAALIPYWRTGGDPTAQLLAAADDPDVLLVAAAFRNVDSADAEPLGSVTRELMTQLPRPIVVVPPGEDAPARIDRVLVALDRDAAATAALEPVLALVAGAEVEIVIVHVCAPDDVPPFADQLQHETNAWVDEFLSGYCPMARDRIRVELRYGEPAGEISAVAARLAADLVVLAWSQSLDAGHAPVVRRLVAQDRIPILLVPIGLVR
jgi:nucleotide-binding universal stress UspA family protein